MKTRPGVEPGEVGPVQVGDGPGGTGGAGQGFVMHEHRHAVAHGHDHARKVIERGERLVPANEGKEQCQGHTERRDKRAAHS